MGGVARIRAAVIGTMVVVVVLAQACTRTPAGPDHRTGHSRPPAGAPKVIHGQAPVVWVSGQVQSLRPTRVILVEETGARVALRLLAEEATRFFHRTGASWSRLRAAEASATSGGTLVCAEALRDRSVYLAIRVYVGTTCGPKG